MGKKLGKGLYWRGDTIWIRTDPLDGKQRSTRCHDVSAANLWLAERERLAASPTYAASTQASVGDWILKTLDFKKGQEKSEGTLHMYGVKLGHITRIFGANSPLAVITPVAVDSYISQRRSEGAKSNTVARELTCLRQMLKLARRAGVFGRGVDEVMPIGFSANYQPITRTLTWEQFNLLVDALPAEHAAWVCLAAATAGDVSDVERMKRDDFDLTTWTVKMRGTKNRSRSATIPIPRPLRPLVERALPFLPVSWPRSSKALGEATVKLGLGHYSPKDLRRSACTWLIEAGVPEDAVSRWMRHKNSTMVRTIYGQMRPEALGSIIDQKLQKRDADHGPLGGIGSHEGFKSRRGNRRASRLRRIVGLARLELARRGLAARTESLRAQNRVRIERLRLFAASDSRRDKAPLHFALALDAAYGKRPRGTYRQLELAADSLELNEAEALRIGQRDGTYTRRTGGRP